MSHRFYYSINRKLLDFLVPSDKMILFYGKNSFGFKRKNITFAKDNNYVPHKKYDYIILNGNLGYTNDVMQVLQSAYKASKPTSRLIIYQHNHLWQWILWFIESLGLKRKEGVQNWLSINDVSLYMSAAGFEKTRVFRRTIFPASLFGVGRIINLIFAILPILDFWKLDQYIIGRPITDRRLNSLTICITVKNEKGNIEPIANFIPKIANNQEILFIEGHSTDGTRDEVKRVIKKYPKQNIRLIKQSGNGQGDAIKLGFSKAKGDVILLYEGDGTSDPRDLNYFYNALAEGRFEFVEGSRFVYPLDNKSMPAANKLGNMFFAKWFSFFLNQRATDVLSGIKGLLKEDFDLINKSWGFLGFNDPFGDFELLYGAVKNGLKIGEIPMRYYPRKYGKSKTNVLKHGTYLLKMALSGYLKFRYT